MKYKIIETYQNTAKTEELLNEMSEQGWVVTGFSQYQILLERETSEETESEQ